MTPLRDKAIAVADAASVEWNRAPLTGRDVPDFLTVAIVDALLAAGMLTDPEEYARTYSLISELIATGKDDDAERAYRLAVKAWRRARDVADGKPLAQRDGEARIERAARDLLMDALGAIYDLGGCDGTCGTTGQCVAKRIRAYLADDQEDTDA